MVAIMVRHCDGDCGNPFCKIAQLEDENEKLRFILDEARQVLMSQHDSNNVNAMLHRIYEMIGYEE